MKNLKILFIGESTPDNIFITKSIIEKLNKIIIENRSIKFKALYISSGSEEFDIIGTNFKKIKLGKIFTSILFAPFLFIGTFIYLFFNTPNLIFTKGGYISLTIILSASIFKIPIFLHETSSSLSSINKFISKRSLIVFTSFNEVKGLDKTKELRLGLPVFEKSLSNYLLSKKALEKFLNINIDKPILFFSAILKNDKKFNDFILNILEDLVKNFFVFHQVTKEEYSQIKKESEVILNKKTKNFYHIFFDIEDPNYIKKLNDIQTISNIMISEFAENIIFKMSAMHKPSILIIFPDKQTTEKNKKEKQKIESAYSYQKMGATIIFEEPNLKKYLFLNKINSLFKDGGKNQELEKISQRAEEFSTPYASKLIATYLFEYWKFKTSKK